MQTFIPHPSFADSLNTLDYKRLGKQRVETKQIYRAALGENGWSHHPAVAMWQDNVTALLAYGLCNCIIWRDQGYNDSLQPYFAKRLALRLANHHQPATPSWLGRRDVHTSHKANLIRKDREHYAPQFDIDIACDGYVWPSKHEKV